MFLPHTYVDKLNSVVSNSASKGPRIQYVLIVLELSEGPGVSVGVRYGQDNIQEHHTDGYFLQHGEHLKFFLSVNKITLQ